MKMIDINSIKNKLGNAAFLKNFDPKKFKFNKKIFFLIVAALIALAVVVRTAGNIQRTLFKKKIDISSKSKMVTFEEEATAVKAYKVKRMDFKDTLPALGNIKGFKEVELKFQVAGIIESFNFEEGEKIQEGDIIASLIQKEALLKLKYAEIELGKNQKLFDMGAINSIKIEQSKLEYESAKNDLDKTNIYAMTNGVMGPRTMDVGSYVNPSGNDRAGIFVSVDKVYAEFNIIEKDVPKIALGQRVEVFLDAYPGKSFNGSIDRISPGIEGRSRTETIKVELDNKDGILKPGMFVRSLIATYEKKDALVVPASSLKKKENEYLAYVIHKEDPKNTAEAVLAKGRNKEKAKGLFGIFGIRKKEDPNTQEPMSPKEKAAEYGSIEIRKITPGYMSEDLVEVNKGIEEGDLVVAEVQEEFKDKTRVEIAEVQEGIL
ncbi:MAG: efflux RND transporter periplasmic adaptor subunit [Candidatus Omnitrophota bacterium]|nr:efflux RND transporter periplasmic adaptor subunit [Candidatus Omnitrophota bacterium]